MQNRAVVSLAFLSVNFNQSKSYLDNFVPLIGECLRLGDEDVVSLQVLQERMHDEFGLQIPQNAIRSILRRAQKEGYVRPGDGVYYRDAAELAQSNFHEVQQEVLRMHGELVPSLVEFANKQGGLVWSTDDAEAALQDYIQDNEIAILAGSKKGIVAEAAAHVRHSRYVVARFARHLEQNHTGNFDYFETIVKGSMLASAIFLPDPEQARARFAKHTEIYFDTPFLIYALGYSGDARRDPCQELLGLMRETGAALRCFRHTLDEIHGALDACARAIGDKKLLGPIRESVEYFIQIHADAADIFRYAARLEQDLDSLHISVVDTPPYKEYAFVIDEAAFASAVDERFDYRPEARDRDVASIAAIMRLRRGEAYYLIEQCRAMFVTTNAGLARIAREFVEHDLGDSSLAPCITDHALTTVLWLKNPIAAPDLPRKKIIADCYAATQPGEGLMRKYLAKVDALEAEGEHTESEYYLLRHSMEARSALMDRTMGDEDAFTQGTVAEILDMAKASIEGEAREKYESAQRQLADAKRAELERMARIRSRARTYGHRIALMGQYGVIVLFLVAAALLFPWKLPGLGNAMFRYIGAAITATFFLATSANLYWGRTIKTMVSEVEARVTDWIEPLLRGVK